MTLVNLVLQYLQNGTIPASDKMQNVCGQVAVIYASFKLWAAQNKKPVTVQLINNVDDTGCTITGIHSMWFTVGLRDVIKNIKTITGDFEGLQVMKVSEIFEVFIAYTDILQHTCPLCDQVFHSDVNMRRCEASHLLEGKRLSKKRHNDTLRVGTLAAFWDAMDLEERRAIVKSSAEFLSGVPPECVFQKTAQRIVDAAKGEVGFTGTELMASLEQVSEHTYDLRLARSMKKPMLYSRTDYLAAMANEIIYELATAHTEAAARDILRLDEEAKKAEHERKEKKRIKDLEIKMFQKRPMALKKVPVRWADDDY